MPLQQEIKDVLQNVLQLDDVSSWNNDTPLLGSIAEFDSMALVTFLTTIEENYGIFVEDDEVSAEIFETLGSVIEFLQTKLS